MNAESTPPDMHSDGVKVEQRQGLTIVTLLPEALDTANWSRAGKHLRELVQSATRGVVVDCRQLPDGVVEGTGPLFHDLLVLGRRKLPKVEIGVVGGAQQTTGDSQLLVMPPRFDSIDAAVVFLDKRELSEKLSFHRGLGVSEVPLDGEPNRPPTLLTRVARVTVVSLLLGATISIVAYSALQSFGKGPRRSLPIRELARSGAGTKVAVYGSIGYASEGVSKRDAGAAVVMWPANPASQKFALSAKTIFEFEHFANDDEIVYTQADEAGDFVLMRRALSGFGNGQYHLLVLSANRQRTAPPSSSDVERLATYFQSPEELLDKHDYYFTLVTVDILDPCEHNVFFGEGELRPVKKPLTVGSGHKVLTPEK